MLGNNRGRERRYSSSACLACRKRKIKCTNDRPRCSNCRVYDIDCVFGNDRRRTSSTIKTISALSTRMDSLESLLIDQQATQAMDNNPPALSSSCDTTLNPISYESRDPSGPSVASLGQLQSGHGSQTNGHYGEPDMDYWVQIAECPPFLNSGGSELQGGTAEVDSDTTTGPDNGDYRQLVHVMDKDAPSPKRPFRPEDVRSNSDSFNQASPSFRIGSTGPRAPSTAHAARQDVLENEITVQLANRVGKMQLAEDGYLHYYGATSNLHMINHGLLSLFESSIPTIRSNGDQALRENGLYWAGNAAYEKHLTSLYFAWHNPLLNEIDKDVYLREKEVYEAGHYTPYYSPTLENAILAVGAAYSSRQHPGNRDDAAEFFGSRAKTLLDIEISSPTLATAQALLVLSGHEAAKARDSRGWIYAGMAVQVVTDLGLHLSLEHDPMEFNPTNGAGKIAQLRKNMFWATHTATVLWSSYSGRPFPMNPAQHSPPDSLSPMRYKWEYYVDRAEQPTLPPELDLSPASMVPMYITHLAIMMGKIVNCLYEGRPESPTDAHVFRATMATELQQWKESLPTSLHVNISKDWRANEIKLYLPMVLQLHMQYHEATILLHRSFISQSRNNSPSTITSAGTSSNLQSAAAQCTASASAIARLLVLYRRQWGLQQVNIQTVHIVMTAGIQHAHDCCVLAATAARTARDGLHVCLQALGDMGQTFQSGNRGLQVVSSLMHDWQNLTFAVRRGRSFQSQGAGFLGTTTAT